MEENDDDRHVWTGMFLAVQDGGCCRLPRNQPAYTTDTQTTSLTRLSTASRSGSLTA